MVERDRGKRWRKEMEERDGGKFLMNVMSIYLKRTSPRSTLSLARASPKAANIHNRW